MPLAQYQMLTSEQSAEAYPSNWVSSRHIAERLYYKSSGNNHIMFANYIIGSESPPSTVMHEPVM